MSDSSPPRKAEIYMIMKILMMIIMEIIKRKIMIIKIIMIIMIE